MTTHIRLQSSTIEPLTTRGDATDDPTGSTIEFAVTTIDAEDDDIEEGDWVEGEWESWANSVWQAKTPTVGKTGADIELPASSPLTLWSRIGGLVVDRAATLFID